MLLVSFFYCNAHRARGYFRYVLTVVWKYHLHFLGPYSIITHKGLGLVLCLLYQGILNWFYCLDSFVCCECFIHLFSSGVQGRSPAGGWEKLEHFLKYTAWNLMSGENERHNLMQLIAFFIAMHTSIVLFQCHVAQCLASWGHGPLAP